MPGLVKYVASDWYDPIFMIMVLLDLCIDMQLYESEYFNCLL